MSDQGSQTQKDHAHSVRISRAATMEPHTATGTPHRTTERRGSLGTTRRRESDSYNHLADDLTLNSQAQQDSFFFNRENSATPGSARRPTLPSHSQQTLYQAHALSQSPVVHPSTVAARFYRQHRNLSDSSIDSQGGAYIDHRRHAPFLPSVSRAAGNSGGIRTQASDARARAQQGSEGEDDDEHLSDHERRRSHSPSSPSHRGRRGTDEHVQSSVTSTGTIRPGITTADLEENAIEDDDERMVPQDALQRHGSRNYRSLASASSPGHDYPNDLSRAGSQQGQEDVCFPAHGGDTTDLLDLGIDNLHDAARIRESAHQHHHAGVAGVLSNFPFPFDFGALEEFAEKERDGVVIPSILRQKSGGLSTSPPGISSATRGRVADDAGVKRTVRQRKLSESVAPGRLRQNLFDNPSIPVTEAERDASRQRVHASILDVKTPLLPHTSTKAYGDYGTGNARPSTNSTSRPYRFSFYSNALPSTIHARSLAEIPAEGQTFEELFVGHQTDDQDSSGPESRGPVSPPGTGANTPVNLQSSRASTNGARPGGIAMSHGNGQDRIKGGMMRTEVDAESNSWWLDVLCPTDAEMKVLSKVRFAFYDSVTGR